MSTTKKSATLTDSKSTTGLEPISLAESRRLISLEDTIKRGVGTFIEVGEALLEIRDARLYRMDYGTFEEYCREKWSFTKTQANRLVQSAVVAAALTPIGVIPNSESQIRPLTKLKEPAKQREAWEKAVESSPTGQPTAKDVDFAVRELTEPTHNSQTEPEPLGNAQKANRPGARAPSDGLQYAMMAIGQLKKIHPRDTQRIAAGQKVDRWINENLI